MREVYKVPSDRLTITSGMRFCACFHVCVLWALSSLPTLTWQTPQNLYKTRLKNCGARSLALPRGKLPRNVFLPSPQGNNVSTCKTCLRQPPKPSDTALGVRHASDKLVCKTCLPQTPKPSGTALCHASHKHRNLKARVPCVRHASDDLTRKTRLPQPPIPSDTASILDTPPTNTENL